MAGESSPVISIFVGVLQSVTNINKGRGVSPSPSQQHVKIITLHISIPLYATIYKNQTNEYILQVIIRKNGEQIVFLFTRGYCCCNTRVSLWELLEQQYYLIGNVMSAILKFDKAYPEYHLAAYAMRSQNILIPLLAGEYHTGIELAAKCGATGVAEGFKYLSVFNEDPSLYNNLRDMFGVPVWVLRALSRWQVCDRVIKRLKKIFDYRPAFLRFDSYTDSMMEFIYVPILRMTVYVVLPGMT